MARLLEELRPKGINFTRCAIAQALKATLAVGEGEREVARRFGYASLQDNVARAARGLAAGDLDAPEGWPSAMAEYVEAVLEASIIGRLRGTRRLPLNLPYGSASGAAAGWISDGQAIGISAPELLAGTMAPRTVGAMVVVTKPLLLRGGPKFEAALRRDLIAACVAAVDTALLDGGAGSPARPASITAGAEPVPGDATLEAMPAVISAFAGDLTQAAWVAHPVTLASLHDALLRPLVGLAGGELLGLAVIASRRAPLNQLILVDPGGLLIGDGGSATIDASESADIEMTDLPVGSSVTPGPSPNMVSMFQTNSVAIRTTVDISWLVVRAGSVAVLALPGAAS